MIKRYLQFIKENLNDFNSLGEWVESLIDDDYVRNIVARYTSGFDPSLEISNVINLLDNREQNEIKSQIERYLEMGLTEPDEIDVLATTETEDLLESVIEGEISVAGKGVFSSFLKSLTALGQKESNPNWENCPEDFLIYYYFELMAEDVKLVFSRFKSLMRYESLIDWGRNEVSLYFGIKCNGQFEYGVAYEEGLKPIGQFKLSKTTMNWFLKLESQSARSLKKEIVNLSYSDILTLGSIKLNMKTFNPGYHEKKSFPIIRDGVISFGYYGVGKWDNGKLDEGELMNIKNNFTTWVISKKWGTKVLVSVKPESFWLWINIKLK
jgi:hypothetical protein